MAYLNDVMLLKELSLSTRILNLRNEESFLES